jgi:hypothetical protein
MEGVMTHSNLSPVEIADRLNDLARKAGALTAAIQGMNRGDLDNEDITDGIKDIAWEIRDELRKLSDVVCPDDGVKIKAVAS